MAIPRGGVHRRPHVQWSFPPHREHLGDTSVVVHRFGGTYGPARFVVAVDDAADEGIRTGLWLTLSTQRGRGSFSQLRSFPSRSPGMLSPVRSAAVGVPPVPQAGPELELPKLAGTGSDAWSMTAIVVGGRPLLALGADNGSLRLWHVDVSPPTELRIGSSPARLVTLPTTDGRPLLAAASGDILPFIDPVTGGTINRMRRNGSETITALTVVARPDGSTWVAVGTSDGSIELADTSRASFQPVQIGSHRGPLSR